METEKNKPNNVLSLCRHKITVLARKKTLEINSFIWFQKYLYLFSNLLSFKFQPYCGLSFLTCTEFTIVCLFLRFKNANNLDCNYWHCPAHLNSGKIQSPT